jgi:hypothetical protein
MNCRFRFAVAMCVALTATGMARSSVIFVRETGGNDANTGTSWSSAKATISAALATTGMGDEVRVGKGTYENCLLTVPAGVAFLGGFDPGTGTRDPVTNATILSGNSSGPVVSLADSTAAAPQRVDGFTITGGNGGIAGSVVVATISNNVITGNVQNRIIPNTWIYDGGGISIEDVPAALAGSTANLGNVQVQILNNTITNNTTTGWGGGIGIANGTAVISGNDIRGNAALNTYGGQDGGGVMLSVCNAQVSDCNLSNNTCPGNGGGLVSFGLPGTSTDIRRCIIANNISRFSGSGLEFVTGTDRVADCLIQGNRSLEYPSYGAGIGSWNESLTVDRCRFIGNWAANNSGAIELDGNTTANTVVISNSLFDSNYANQFTGGITVATSSPVSIIGNTFVNNHSTLGGGGVSAFSNFTSATSHPLIMNNIAAYNDGGFTETPGSGSTSRNNCAFGNNLFQNAIANSQNDFIADPMFVNAVSGNYRLQTASPCVGAGDDSVVDGSWLDLNLGARTQGAHVDLGALEGDFISPAANGQTLSLEEDTTLGITLTGTETGSGIASFDVATQPTHGTLSGTAPNLVYTPNSHYHGPDQFTFTITDRAGNVSPAASVALSVVNQAPVAFDDDVTTSKNTPALAAVTANDTDYEHDPLTVSSLTQPAHGTVVINANSTVTYSPIQGYIGSDSFTYTISDGAGNTATAAVNVKVQNTSTGGTPPTAVNDSASTANHTPVSLTPLTNDSGAGTLAILSITQPANGTAVLGSNNVVTYTPNGSFNGTDKFTYTMTDSSGLVATATVSVSVAANKSPVASPDSASVVNGGTVTLNVTLNDTDPEGDKVTITGITQPASGLVVVNTDSKGNPDGTVTYASVSGFKGKVTFTYTISDGYGGTATGTVAVTVTSSMLPIANNDNVTVTRNTSDNPIDVLVNDSDPSGTGLTIDSWTAPSGGSVRLSADGRKLLFNAPNVKGKFRFDYTIRNAFGTATATVTVTVQ